MFRGRTEFLNDRSLSYEVLRGTSAFLSLKETWENLLDHSQGPGRVFLRHDWIRAWLDLRSGHTPLIVLIYHGHTVVGIIPLCERVHRSVWKTLMFLGGHDADYHDVIVDVRYDGDLVYSYARQIVETLGKAGAVLCLEELAEGTPLHQAFSHGEVASREPCPYIDTRQPWSDYQRRICDEDVRRKMRKAERLGSVRYGVVESSHHIAAFVDEFCDTHQQRWALTDTPSRFQNPKDRVFLRQVAEDLFPGGHMHLAYLTIDDRRVAYFYGFREERRLSMYLLTFHPDFAKISIGKVFLYHLIREEYSRYQIIDLLRGDEPYKRHWATDVATNETFLVYRSRIHRAVAELYRHLGNG